MEKPFCFPDALLKQVEECSNGGFILLYLDEDRNIEVALSYDSEASLRSLVSKGESWSMAMSEFLSEEDKHELEDFYNDEQQS
jgi:hypothetical protein